jgi:hypothetical protein
MTKIKELYFIELKTAIDHDFFYLTLGYGEAFCLIATQTGANDE